MVEPLDCRSMEVAKTNILSTVDEIVSPTAVVGLPVVAGQRSRRSSGYASASSSPSTKRPVVPIDDDGNCTISEPWTSSLYEVTLRWMFETDPLIDETSLIAPLHCPQNIVHVASPSVNEALTVSDPVHQQSSATAVRIYLHLMQRHNKMPTSFIDLLPVPPANPDGRPAYALVFQNGCLANETFFSRYKQFPSLIF